MKIVFLSYSAAVDDEITALLAQRNMESFYGKWLQGLRARYDVKVMESNLKKLELF